MIKKCQGWSYSEFWLLNPVFKTGTRASSDLEKLTPAGKVAILETPYV